jgi:hypothetical protein
VTLSTDFRSPPENGHSRYGRLTGSKKKTALHMLERNISTVLAQSLEGSPKSLQGNDRDEAGWSGLGRGVRAHSKKGSMSGLNLFVRALNPDWPGP